MANPVEFISRIKKLGSNRLSFSKTFLYEKEAIAAGILLFPNFVHAGLVFIPAIISLAVYLFSPWIIESSFSTISQIETIQLDNMFSSIQAFKMTSIFLIGYFGVIKFQQNKDTGDYGYWLALGVDRLTFYNYNIFGFTMNGVFSAIILLVHILLIESLYIPFTWIIFLLLLTFSSLYLFSSLVFFIYQAIDNAEMTFLTVVLTYLISLFFVSKGNPLHSVFNAELYFNQESWYILFVIQFGLATLLHYMGWRIHREIDVELGG